MSQTPKENESNESALERIRRVRHQISAECGQDPYRLVEYYMKLQEQHRDRLATPAEGERTDSAAA